MAAVLGIVVVVIQIQTGGAQIHFVSLLLVAELAGDNRMQARGEGGLVNGERFVEVEIALLRLQVVPVAQEVQALQHVGLLDVTGA
ncbi:hypothetical protein D1872_327750 [compost metagenome]